ncbi:MAG: hypothetical protein QXU20_01155 [Candidatus Woesearchaeota archaeon]
MTQKQEKVMKCLDKLLEEICKKPHTFNSLEKFITNKTDNLKVDVAYLKENNIYFTRINIYNEEETHLRNFISLLKEKYHFEWCISYSENYLILKSKNYKNDINNEIISEGNSSKERIKEKFSFNIKEISQLFIRSRDLYLKENKKTKLFEEVLRLDFPEIIHASYSKTQADNLIKKIEEIYKSNNILIEFKDKKERTKNFLYALMLIYKE